MGQVEWLVLDVRSQVPIVAGDNREEKEVPSAL